MEGLPGLAISVSLLRLERRYKVWYAWSIDVYLMKLFHSNALGYIRTRGANKLHLKTE